MAQSKAMELDLENEIEKTKKEGILFVILYSFWHNWNWFRLGTCTCGIFRAWEHGTQSFQEEHLDLKQKVLSKQLVDMKCIPVMTSLKLLTKGYPLFCTLFLSFVPFDYGSKWWKGLLKLLKGSEEYQQPQEYEQETDGSLYAIVYIAVRQGQISRDFMNILAEMK